MPDSEAHNGIRQKVARKVLSLLILAMLYNQPLCSNELRNYLQKKFEVNISSPSIYTATKKLQSEGLIGCYSSSPSSKSRKRFVTSSHE